MKKLIALEVEMGFDDRFETVASIGRYFAGIDDGLSKGGWTITPRPDIVLLDLLPHERADIVETMRSAAEVNGGNEQHVPGVAYCRCQPCATCDGALTVCPGCGRCARHADHSDGCEGCGGGLTWATASDVLANKVEDAVKAAEGVKA